MRNDEEENLLPTNSDNNLSTPLLGHHHQCQCVHQVASTSPNVHLPPHLALTPNSTPNISQVGMQKMRKHSEFSALKPEYCCQMVRRFIFF